MPSPCPTLGRAFAAVTCALLCGVALAADPAPVARHYRLPADAGVVNVRDPQYGAKGDGVTDDTAAIRKAIAAGSQHSRYSTPAFVYFPAGTYLISGPLESRGEEFGWSGGWRSGMLLLGEDRGRTVIKLKDRAEGYGDAAKPRWVIATGSESDKKTKAGDPPLLGNGNRAFRHSVINLTVDVGAGNPGAVAIDYVANNRGTIEAVTIRSSDPQRLGHTGLRLTREWPGPCLIRDVVIEGFERGIQSSHFQYSVTFVNLTLRHQRTVGILNSDNVLAFEGLESQNAVRVVRSTGESGAIVIVGGRLAGPSPHAAIEGKAELYLRDLEVRGYGKAVDTSRPGAADVDGGARAAIDFYSTEAIALGVERAEPLRLPIRDTPHYWNTDHTQWVSPRRFRSEGADGDWTDAVQAAMNSGKPVVYFPNGSYGVSRTITVPPSVRLIIGMQSSLGVGKDNVDKVDPVLRFTGTGGPGTTVEHMWITGHVEHDADRPVAFRHSDIFGRYQNTPAGRGDFFAEDTIGPKPLLIRHPQNAWCRQFNVEFGSIPLVENHGGNLWMLMYKTEGQMVCLEQTAGKTEILGALLYTLRDVKDGTPAFHITGGEAALTYAMNGPGYPNEVRLLSREGDATLRSKQTRGRCGGLVRVRAGDDVDVAPAYLDRVEVFDGGAPFWAARPGDADPGTRADADGNRWSVVKIGSEPDIARPENWKPLRYDATGQRWVADKLTDQSPSYAAARVLRGRGAGGNLVGLTFTPAKPGPFSVRGRARAEAWNPNGPVRVVVQVVDSRGAVRPLFDAQVPNRGAIAWDEHKSLQGFTLNAGDRLVLTFAPVAGQTGSLFLSPESQPTAVVAGPAK